MTERPTRSVKEKSRLTKEEWREYTKTVWVIANTSRADHPAVFPEELPFRLARMFSFVGETILDPFAGTGTTARAVVPIGRNAICVEQSLDYVQTMERESIALRLAEPISEVGSSTIVHGDSRDLGFINDDTIALVVTSPPYWDKADYGTSANNLGSIDNYAAFLLSVQPVFEECFRVLMPGRKFCVVTANVNQHTDHGLLTFPLATDYAVMLRNIGFVMINEIIWSKDGSGGKWGSYGSQRPIFGSYPYPPNFLFKNVHEYVLIFAKPSTTKTKGRKVRIYSELMADIKHVVNGPSYGAPPTQLTLEGIDTPEGQANECNFFHTGPDPS